MTLIGWALAVGSTVATDNNTLFVPICEPIRPINPGIMLIKTTTGGEAME